MRGKAWRRFQERKIQKRRFEIWRRVGDKEWINSPRIRGQMKKNNFSHSCPACKPYKFGIEPKVKASIRRKMYED